MSNFWFAALVTALYIIIQQVEGNLLVPRILGRSLNLHPLVVLIGIIIGGIFLMLTKVANWRIPLSYLASVALFS